VISEDRAYAQGEGDARENSAEEPAADALKKESGDTGRNPAVESEAGKDGDKKTPVPGRPGKAAQAPAEIQAPVDGLLDITEGSFKYKRIPGIRISEVAQDSNVEISKTGEQEKDKEQAKDGSAGLFGLSQKATDRLAKLVLFGVIILVFVLYRFRTRGRRSSVLKRFPKA
jgi:hypothetical protein